VILNGPRIHTPSLNGVAALALRPELTLVKIRMAVRATGSGFGKDFRDMARITGHVLMHAAKLEASFGIVIEFDPRAKRRPVRRCVTILARKRNLPVGVGNVNLRESW
jgi:hypothetical protein